MADNERSVILDVQGVSKKYNEKTVLCDVSFSIKKGGIHAILGPNGAGKTALMDIMAGCTDADSGVVYMNGMKVGSGSKDIKRKIGYMPELPIFYNSMTAIEIMDFIGDVYHLPSEKRYAQIKEAFELVGLEDMYSRRIERMTKEQRKRLSMAASLLGNPDILLFDEPLFGKSEDAIQDSYSIIKRLGKIKTVIVSTSSFSDARALCEDIIIICDGKLLAKGSFDELEAKLLRSRSLHVTTRGEASYIVPIIEAIKGVISCFAEKERGNRNGEIKLTLEYRADNDIRDRFSSIMSEHGYPILSMGTDSISLESVYDSLIVSADKSAIKEKIKKAKEN